MSETDGMRRAARVDANQQAIIIALRQVGASVQPLHQVGKGCPDLLVGYMKANYVLEVKDGMKPPSDRQLTAEQQEWHAKWRGRVVTVMDAREALEAIGVRSR
jgi:hypothetical protein